MILVIDNYDSFVFNLARYFCRLGQTVEVVRNGAMDPNTLRHMRPLAIVISPGPGTPQDAGCSLSIVRELGEQFPILGVCLGHQAIGVAFGARLARAAQPMHGRTSWIRHNGRGVFAGIPSPLRVGRYHSLVIEEDQLPPCLEVTARTEDGVVMALAHRERPVVGVQFHPESILTDCGFQLLASFLRMAGIATLPPAALFEYELVPPPSRHVILPSGPVTF
jgi:anthranilate synthase/aminodeoxychorismate synthase-like glutamine amidotransferase